MQQEVVTDVDGLEIKTEQQTKTTRVYEPSHVPSGFHCPLKSQQWLPELCIFCDGKTNVKRGFYIV